MYLYRELNSLDFFKYFLESCMGVIMALLVFSPISAAHSCLFVLRYSWKLESWARLTAKITCSLLVYRWSSGVVLEEAVSILCSMNWILCGEKGTLAQFFIMSCQSHESCLIALTHFLSPFQPTLKSVFPFFKWWPSLVLRCLRLKRFSLLMSWQDKWQSIQTWGFIYKVERIIIFVPISIWIFICLSKWQCRVLSSDASWSNMMWGFIFPACSQVLK